MVGSKQCSICGRHFARAEHLTRHVRTHTKEKPFPCPHCQQKFSRQDLQVKHLRVHSRTDQTGGASNNNDTPPRKRAKTACDACRRMKVRCKCTTQHDSNWSAVEAESSTTLVVDTHGNPPEADSLNIDASAVDFLPMNQNFDMDEGLTTNGFIDWNFGSLLDDTLDMLGLNDPYGITFEYSNDTLPSGVQSALAMVQSYHQSARTSSLPRDTTPRGWFSELPSPQSYDFEIVNTFLNLAVDNLGETFELLSDIDVTVDNRPELCLSLAAVGGLFCEVSGSYTVAKALYHDARRLLLAYSTQRACKPAVDIDRDLSFSKTFIFLEIYGLCSGDKRSYEFVEVFHTDILQVIGRARDALFVTNGDKSETPMVKILEAVEILESYRRVFLQRSSGSFSSLSQDPPARLSLDALLQRPFTDPPYARDTIGDGYMRQSSLSVLSTASRFVPHVSPGAFGGVRVPDLWRSEAAELSLNNWLRSQQLIPASTLLLYHMIHLSIHTNLELLQYYAISASHSKDAAHTNSFIDEIRNWSDSPDCTVALWHAATILSYIQGNSLVSNRGQAGQQPNIEEIPPLTSPLLGAPHVPYCIYYATLVLWSHLRLEKQPTYVQSKQLRTGIYVLASLKVRIGKILGNALQEIAE